MNKNFYEILGVDRNASDAEIKSVYRKLAIKYHPDKNKGDKAAEERFKEISVAYEILSDPQKRKEYDYQLDHPGGGGFDINDLFNQFFGGGGPFGGFGGFGGFSSNFQRARKSENLNLKLTLSISFEEAYTGCEKEIRYNRTSVCPECAKNLCQTCGGSGNVQQIQRTPFGIIKNVGPCSTCNGTGHISNSSCKLCKGKGEISDVVTFSLNVPKGAFNGLELHCSGKGKIGSDGNTGDLYIVISTPETSSDGKYMRNDTFNLITSISLPYYNLLFGCNIDMTMPDGRVETFSVPAKFDIHNPLVINNKGFKIINAKSNQENGNLLIVISLDYPNVISDESKQLLSQFNESIR